MPTTPTSFSDPSGLSPAYIFGLEQANKNLTGQVGFLSAVARWQAGHIQNQNRAINKLEQQLHYVRQVAKWQAGKIKSLEMTVWNLTLQRDYVIKVANWQGGVIRHQERTISKQQSTITSQQSTINSLYGTINNLQWQLANRTPANGGGSGGSGGGGNPKGGGGLIDAFAGAAGNIAGIISGAVGQNMSLIGSVSALSSCANYQHVTDYGVMHLDARSGKSLRFGWSPSPWVADLPGQVYWSGKSYNNGRFLSDHSKYGVPPSYRYHSSVPSKDASLSMGDIVNVNFSYTWITGETAHSASFKLECAV